MDSIQQEREPDTEKRILEAAALVFMRKGKLGASMQDIADEAGINRTLLHYYFRHKDKLFDNVFEKLFTSAFPALAGIMASDRPLPDRIEQFIETYSKLLQENPYLPVFIFQEISLNPGRLTDILESKGFRPEQILKKFRSELEHAGMPGIDPRHFFASMMGMVLFPYIGRPLFETLAFRGDANEYDNFLSERTKHIPWFINQALKGAGAQQRRT